MNTYLCTSARSRRIARGAVALLVTAALGAGAAACGSGGNSSAGGSSTSAGAGETSPDEPTPAETTEPTPAATKEAGGASSEFCAAAAAMSDLGAAMSTTDLAQMMESMNAVVSQMKAGAAIAPAEISADWNTITNTIDGIVKTLNEALANPTDADAVSKVGEAMGALSAQDVNAAGERVGAYIDANC